MPDEFLTVREAATVLRTTAAALYQWRRRRQGPPGAIVGGRLLYRRADLDAFVARLVAADPKAAAQ